MTAISYAKLTCKGRAGPPLFLGRKTVLEGCASPTHFFKNLITSGCRHLSSHVNGNSSTMRVHESLGQIPNLYSVIVSHGELNECMVDTAMSVSYVQPGCRDRFADLTIAASLAWCSETLGTVGRKAFWTFGSR